MYFFQSSPIRTQREQNKKRVCLFHSSAKYQHDTLCTCCCCIFSPGLFLLQCCCSCRSEAPRDWRCYSSWHRRSSCCWSRCSADGVLLHRCSRRRCCCGSTTRRDQRSASRREQQSAPLRHHDCTKMLTHRWAVFRKLWRWLNACGKEYGKWGRTCATNSKRLWRGADLQVLQRCSGPTEVFSKYQGRHVAGTTVGDFFFFPALCCAALTGAAVCERTGQTDLPALCSIYLAQVRQNTYTPWLPVHPETRRMSSGLSLP